jgi:anti-anti-sigma factor
VETQRHLPIDMTDDAGQVVLSPQGEIDYGNVAHLRAALLALSSQNSNDVTVDLGDVSFIDSTALSVLIQAHQRMSGQGGKLTLVGAQPRVARVFQITGTESYFAAD